MTDRLLTPPAAACFNGGGPASLQLQGRDQLTCNELMNKDYQGADWHCLAAGDPPQLTLCDWVFAANTYTERGTGAWYRGPNAGGFSTEQGAFVSDPERTYWKAVDPQPANPPFVQTGYEAKSGDQEYQQHIRHTHADLETSSWCGEQLNRTDWTFQNIDHAIYAIQQGTLQQPCPDCLAAIKTLIP